MVQNTFTLDQFHKPIHVNFTGKEMKAFRAVTSLRRLTSPVETTLMTAVG